MRVSSLVYGLLIVGIVFTGLYATVSEMTDTDEGGYTIRVDQQDFAEESSGFDEIADITNELSDSYKNLTEFSAETKLSYLTLVPQGLILVKNMVVVPLRVMHSIVIGGALDSLDLPIWVNGFIAAVVIMLFLFGLVALILRYKFT